MVIARPAATWLAARPIDQEGEDRRRAPPPQSAAPTTPTSVESVSVGDGEAGRGADDHHPLEAEIEHAGALGDDLADRGEQQRRRRRDDDHQDVDDRLAAHARALRVKVRR